MHGHEGHLRQPGERQEDEQVEERTVGDAG